MSSWHLFGVWTVAPKHEETYAEEVWRWYVEFKNYSFAFRTGGDSWITYNFHAWTIPVEFRGSIIVYTSILALSKCTKNRRFTCYAILMWYFMYVVDGWFGVLFLAGTVLCELDILSKKNDLPRWMTSLKPYQGLIFYAMFIIGILLGGIPSHTANVEKLKLSPGWYYLAFLKPEAAWDYKWFFLFFASTFLISSIPRISWLKGFFETSFNQYLGRISFSLYLIHGPVLWTIGDRLYSAAGWYREANETHIPQWINIFPLSKEGPLGLEPSFLLPHLILLPLTLWLAEVATKLFDEPSVRFSQWAYQTALGPRVESL
jgi:peptidoglycan/LPS O-acetylase OafA/YrhL